MLEQTQGSSITKNGKFGENLVKSYLQKSKLSENFCFIAKGADFKGTYKGKSFCIEVKSASGEGGQNRPAINDAIRRAAKEYCCDFFLLVLLGGTRKAKVNDSETTTMTAEEFKKHGWPKIYENEVLETMHYSEDHMQKSPNLFKNPNLKFFLINLGFESLDNDFVNKLNDFADFIEKN